MFGSNKDKLDYLSKQLTDLQGEKLMLETRLDDALNSIEEFASNEIKYTKQISNLKQTHKTEMDKLEASVNKRVNATLASIGVEQFASNTFSDVPKQSDADIYQKFLSLYGKQEQSEFYKANKEAISRSLLAN